MALASAVEAKAEVNVSLLALCGNIKWQAVVEAVADFVDEAFRERRIAK